MLRTTILVSIFGLSLTAAACTSDELARNEGVTGTAGNAIAADTALQMVDPWPRGVENANLRVPAERPRLQNKKAVAAPAASSDNTSAMGN